MAVFRPKPIFASVLAFAGVLGNSPVGGIFPVLASLLERIAPIHNPSLYSNIFLEVN